MKIPLTVRFNLVLVGLDIIIKPVNREGVVIIWSCDLYNQEGAVVIWSHDLYNQEAHCLVVGQPFLLTPRC